VGAIIGSFAIWGVFGQRAITLGMGQTAYGDVTPMLTAALAEFIGTALLMFAILGIVDAKSPGDLAGIVIGGAVVAIIMVIGPVTGASLNPARAFGPELISAIAGGPTHWVQYIPVYLVPGLAGAAVAAFVYDFLANPRIEEYPIKEAVTQPETVQASTATAQ
jgi:glycerol uptake facilitator protein